MNYTTNAEPKNNFSGNYEQTITKALLYQPI